MWHITCKVLSVSLKIPVHVIHSPVRVNKVQHLWSYIVYYCQVAETSLLSPCIGTEAWFRNEGHQTGYNIGF